MPAEGGPGGLPDPDHGASLRARQGIHPGGPIEHGWFRQGSRLDGRFLSLSQYLDLSRVGKGRLRKPFPFLETWQFGGSRKHIWTGDLRSRVRHRGKTDRPIPER